MFGMGNLLRITLKKKEQKEYARENTHDEGHE